MAQEALVISRDLVRELNRLAVVASKDDDALEDARKRFVRAGTAVVSSGSTFAVALYDFALRYADKSDLLDAKLDELGIQFKRTSSVYVKISRLAFNDVRDENGEVSRTRVSRYASIIEAAHTAGQTAEQFRAIIERGVTQALRRLRSFGQAPASDAIELGREIASELVGKRTFALEQFPLPDSAAEGDDVELLARVEGGKLVVYGVLPPSVSNVRSMLSKLGSPSGTDTEQLGILLPDMLRAIKLVTGSKAVGSLARYEIVGDRMRFSVFGIGADAVLTAPLDLSCFGACDLTLDVSEWRRIVETLTPLRKHLRSVTVTGAQIFVGFDESAVPDIDKWFEDSGKAKKIGVSDGAALEIDLDGKDIEQDYLVGLNWQNAVTVTQDQMALLLSFKPTKRQVAVPLASEVLKPTATDKPLKGHVNLGRKTLSTLKGATKKMHRLSSELCLEHADGYFRVTSKYDNCLELSLIVPAD